jgi:hypothetical protein
MGGPNMAMEEMIAYVVLLALPLWLLVEQLLYIRTARPPKAPQPDRRPERRPVAPPFPEALRSGQR